MQNAKELLSIIEEEETYSLKDLAEKLQIPEDSLEKIIEELSQHNLLEYNQQTGEVKLASWLANVNKTIENIKPAVGTIIVPRNQEIKIQDIKILNYTETDLEVNIKVKAKETEIAMYKIN